jgi:hypothetical protein
MHRGHISSFENRREPSFAWINNPIEQHAFNMREPINNASPHSQHDAVELLT